MQQGQGTDYTACIPDFFIIIYYTGTLNPWLLLLLQADPSLARRGVAGVYGMVGMVPDKSIVKDFLVTFFNEVYTL